MILITKQRNDHKRSELKKKSIIESKNRKTRRKTRIEPTTVRHVAVRPSGQISFHQRLTTGLGLLLVFQAEEWMKKMETENYDRRDPVGRSGLRFLAGKVSSLVSIS